ncbi:MAG: penicillin-binding protein, partial [Deltaproteobacteria bacterium]
MRKAFKYIFLSLLAMALLAAGGVGIYVWSLMDGLPDIAELSTYKPPLTTTIKSRDGVLMAELYRENRYMGDPRQLPGFVRKAFIAAEDDKFYEHAGLDFQGIIRAALTNLKEGRFAQGGSTITQQVARTLLLSREKSLERKAREGILALQIERSLEKDDILNLYLNQIYLGHGAYGIEAAARVYFGVSAWELSIAQAALLAGLPQAPSRYDPYKNPAQAIDRRGYVLERMFENSWITAEEAEEAKRSPLGLKGYSNPFEDVSPYYSEYVRQALLELFDTDTVLEGGLTVTTSMDSRLQRAAREALREGLKEIDLRGGYRGPVRVLGAAVTGEDALPREEEEAPFFEGDMPTDGAIAEALVTGVSEEGVTVVAGAAVARIPAERLEWTLPRGRKITDLFSSGQVLLCRFEAVEGGGLKASIYQEPIVEGAIISLDPETGEVLAAVGGYDYKRSQFNRFSQAKRQVGSAIKPLIYAAAISSGYTPASLIYDSPIVYESDELDKKWKPKTYSSRFYGATTLRDALVNSRNVVTIKLLKEMGIQRTVNFLRKLGITSEI